MGNTQDAIVQNRVPIVFAFDRSMEMPAAVSIYSLLKNALPDTFYEIFILHPSKIDFSNSPILQIQKSVGRCQIAFVPVDDTFSDAFVIRNISIVTYFRLLIPILFPQYDKILYSDVDVIFQEDLRKYYEVPLDDCYFAGVDASPYFPQDVKKYIQSELRHPLDQGYFYAGNLVINAQLLRKDKMVDTFVKLVASGKFKYQDMDIINISCRGRIKRLSSAFCKTTYIYDAYARLSNRERVDLSAGIIHYNGTKPWNGICPNMDVWWSYYRQSVFYDEKFVHDFWTGQRDSLLRMPLGKRLKLLLRYPLDRKEW